MKYLSTFAQLMRLVLVSTREEGIPLTDEIIVLESYMSLEQLRSNNHFSYDIQVSDNIEKEFISIPSMIIQPYIENAIIHGILNKESKGHILVDFSKVGNKIICTVVDNGIGRKKAREIKTATDLMHKSYGILISTERLNILNDSNSERLVEIVDLYDSNGEPKGTRVRIKLPVLK